MIHKRKKVTCAGLFLVFADHIKISASCMAFAERLPCLHEETLPFQVLFAERAVKALGVVIIVESLHPPVPCFDGKATGDALSREQLIPIFLAVGETIF